MKCPTGGTRYRFSAGETVKFNAEMTGGAPYVAYDGAAGSFLIAKPGLYVVNLRLHAPAVESCGSARISWVLNGQAQISHAVATAPAGCPPLSFTDLLEVTAPNSALALVNEGPDLVVGEPGGEALSACVWGSV